MMALPQEMKIPNLATTGIGSLPQLEVEAALEMAFQVDIPYFPTLPQLGPEEEIFGGMLAASEWKFASPGKAWSLFLKRIQQKKCPWVKLQWVGPVTLRLAATNLPSNLIQEREAQLRGHLGSMVEAVRQLGSSVLFFIDEPSFFQLNLNQESHAQAFAELGGMIQRLQQLGAHVGVHCCGDADFGLLFSLGVPVISFDAAISLPKILQAGSSFLNWIQKGCSLALGIVPTELPFSWNAVEEVQKCRTLFFQALGKEQGLRILRNSLLTPACGLGLRKVGEAEVVFEALREFQGVLKGNL